jgi:tRNA1(Val) A37 N6-methylase TrmN6
MARSTAKKVEQNLNQEEMFVEHRRDYTPYYSSSLFSDVYLRNDLPRDYKHLWENDEVGGFYHFYQEFVNLCHATESLPFESLKEQDTVTKWIVPVMELLGWENNSTKFAKSFTDNTSFVTGAENKKQAYRPDLIYYEQPSHLEYTLKENKDPEAKLAAARDDKFGAKIVVEAKYWDRLATDSIDKKRDKGESDSASALGPELQTLKYMELLNLPFGILTDGKTWKLLHVELSQGVDCRNFRFDLGRLKELALDLGSGLKEQEFRKYAKYFYYFFCKESLVKSNGSKTQPLMYQILEYSKKYAHSIEDDLRKRFIITMGITCNALKNSCVRNKEPVDLVTIRNVAESHLFNILFVKSCEVRGILPIKTTNYLKVSLHMVIELLTDMKFDPDKHLDDYFNDFRRSNLFDPKKFSFDGFEIFERFINLYEIIHDGTNQSMNFGFEIQGFKESIFSKHEWAFAKKHKISNRDMIRILFNLNFIESKSPDRKYQQIPYSYFTSRQLGSIYESFLEYKLEIAPTDLIFSKGQWTEANLKSRHVKNLNLADAHEVTKGDLFFSPNNEERKMTGSYYTPDYVVRYMIKEAIGPLISSLTSDEILNLKICDPAMGSGHFVAGTLDYLVEAYRQKWTDEHNDDLEEAVADTARRVLDSCIHGVDMNERAVKLAKMSMWLLTAVKGKKLERLDDQMLCKDSLMELNLKNDFPKIYKRGGFDAVIGNPPYIDAKYSIQFTTNPPKDLDCAEYQPDLYVYFLEKGLKLTRHEGVFAFIVPNSFLHYKTMEKIRNFLFRQNTCDKLVKAYDAFTEVTVDTIIPIIKKTKPLSDKLCIYQLSRDMGEEKISEINYEGNVDEIINLNPRKLDKDVISLMESDSVLLGDICKVKAGIKIRPEFIVKSQKQKTHRKLLKGRNVFPFSIEWDNDWVDYTKKAESKFPNQSLRDSFIFDTEKILIRQTADNLYCTVDASGYVCMQSCYSIYPKKVENSKYIKAIASILNSKIMRDYYESKFKKDKTTFPQIRGYDLEKLPIKKLSPDVIDELADLYNKCANELKSFNGLEIDSFQSVQALNKYVANLYTGKVKSKKAA